MGISPHTQVSSASLAGLITDGNALMNTEQSNLKESNYEIMLDGTRRRRRPIVQETKGDTTFLGSSVGSHRSSYLWESPSFREDYSILCEEINGEIRFYPIDHNNPEYLRTTELDQDRLRLELWGDRSPSANTRADQDGIGSPCTYAEGNGSLYVFNPRSGTIKVSLTEDDRLLMVPIGTWVRDYTGAIETIDVDHRPERGAGVTEYSPGVPFLDPNEDVLITSDLNRSRAYNLSNTGWDAKGISDFMTQSDVDYVVRDPSLVYQGTTTTTQVVDVGLIGTFVVVSNTPLWPALTDKYLLGRQVDERGVSNFSYPQLVQAKEGTNVPPTGARINTSEFTAGGTLVSVPSDRSDETTILTTSPTLYEMQTIFSSRQAHKENLFAGELTCLFLHSFVYTVEQGGRTYQGGYSGMKFGGLIVGTDGKNVGWQHENPALAGYTNFAIESVIAYPAPEYLPHVGYSDVADFSFITSDRRPKAGQVYAGRLWQTSDSHNRFYYSQVLDTHTEHEERRRINKESMCYMYADPTDGDDNAVVATDGGYVNTADTGKHLGAVVLGDSLLLLTDKGIWAVRPGSKGTFSASDFQFTKVASAEVLGVQAYADLGDMVHVATDEGIIALSLESTSFGNTNIKSERLLDRKLIKGYEEILSEWPNVIGEYEAETRTVRWLFTPSTDTEQQEGLQPVLSLSLFHNAWYKYMLAEDSRVLDMVSIPYSADTETYNKFRYLIGRDNGANVFLTGWGVEVAFGEEGIGDWVQDGIVTGEKFADYRQPDGPEVFRDPVPAYMETNHILTGKGINWQQIKYIVVHNRNVTETWRLQGDGTMRPSMEGGTLLSVRWDWMDQYSTGKWSDPYQTYKYRRSYILSGVTEPNTLGEPVLVHKMKLRGRGREFRLFFQSDEHKDSHIEGWAYQGYILNEV